MTTNPYESPETVGKPLERKPSGLKFTLLSLLIVVGILGLLFALLLPAVRTSSEAARRMSCSNNLHQIAIALQNYQDVFHCLPPAYTVDSNGKPLHSWRTLILPYMEQKSLYDKIDLSKPWDDPANLAAHETVLGIYQCPSGNLPKCQTTYLAVVAPGGCFQKTEPRRLDEITDGTDRTLMVIEVPVERAVHWMSPSDAAEESLFSALAPGKTPHPGGAQVVFVSGKVLYLPSKTKAETIRALISIAGNDDDAAQGAD